MQLSASHLTDTAGAVSVKKIMSERNAGGSQGKSPRTTAMFLQNLTTEPYLLSTYTPLTSPAPSRWTIGLQVTLTETRDRRWRLKSNVKDAGAASARRAAPELPRFSSHAHLSLSCRPSSLLGSACPSSPYSSPRFCSACAHRSSILFVS